MAGINTFSINLPVQSGDVLALDNASSALLFDNGSGSATYLTQYYQPATADGTPGLPDGSTGAPNNTRDGYRLLLSATLESGVTTTTTSTTTTTTTTPPPPRPALSHVSETHRVWREGHRLARFTRAHSAPVGTRFSFSLSTAARVRFSFVQVLRGRRVNGKCVAASNRNRQARSCQRRIPRRAPTFSATAGRHTLSFQGRTRAGRLPVGQYRAVITATGPTGRRSAAKTLTFTIASG